MDIHRKQIEQYMPVRVHFGPGSFSQIGTLTHKYGENALLAKEAVDFPDTFVNPIVPSTEEGRKLFLDFM